MTFKKHHLLSLAVASAMASPLALADNALVGELSPNLDPDYEAPRTEWGDPDLRGVWNFSSNTPTTRPADYEGVQFLTPEEVIERNERIAAQAAATDGQSSQGGVGGYNQFWIEGDPTDLNLRTSIIIDPPSGQLPDRVPGAPMAFGGLGPDYDGERPVRVTVGGIAKDGPEDRGLSERCLMGFNAVPPFAPSMYNNNVQLFQTEDHVVILNEMIHHARIVPMDGRPHIPGDITQWTGDSRGYWEGDTLIVETRNFNEKTQTYRGTGVSADKTLIERFHRSADHRIEYEFTIRDDKAYQDEFTGTFPLFATDGKIHEYACHEGNYGMVNILRGERVEEGTWNAEENRAMTLDEVND